MQRGGWGSEAVLKQVYRHALSDNAIEMYQLANMNFETTQHEMQHKKK